jgi:hypothetical protein
MTSYTGGSRQDISWAPASPLGGGSLAGFIGRFAHKVFNCLIV